MFKVGTPDTFKMFAILRPGAGRVTVKAPSRETFRMLLEVEGVAFDKNGRIDLLRYRWEARLSARRESPSR